MNILNTYNTYAIMQKININSVKTNNILNYIGIINWETKKNFFPNFNEKKIHIHHDVQLIIISKKNINLKNTFIQDVLKTINVLFNKVIFLSNNIIPTPFIIDVPCWVLGDVKKTPPITSKQWIIYSNTLDDLLKNYKLKKKLWEKIYTVVLKIKEQ